MRRDKQVPTRASDQVADERCLQVDGFHAGLSVTREASFGGALTVPRHHLAGKPFDGLLVLLLFARRLDHLATFGALQ
jgi:hypothetical protein